MNFSGSPTKVASAGTWGWILVVVVATAVTMRVTTGLDRETVPVIGADLEPQVCGIRLGMSKNDVLRIAGGPPRSDPRSDNWLYDGGKSSVWEVHFYRDSVDWAVGSILQGARAEVLFSAGASRHAIHEAFGAPFKTADSKSLGIRDVYKLHKGQIIVFHFTHGLFTQGTMDRVYLLSGPPIYRAGIGDL